MENSTTALLFKSKHKPTHTKFMALKTFEQKINMVINAAKKSGIFGNECIDFETTDKFYVPRLGSFLFNGKRFKTAKEAKQDGYRILEQLKGHLNDK